MQKSNNTNYTTLPGNLLHLLELVFSPVTGDTNGTFLMEFCENPVKCIKLSA